ncbi:efflux RND transporter periplasmic adaptor subunit [Chitinophaga alhagiae]|uniref:efflux RND transporter periplasmic adaptor subunit n=1 Tax=Chitinophaga alhagiae TaxID=2203219 RepID=UPI000E5B2312|nr:efflux RND transporter periplasmic adaptor subunit [Chitinophaga alhagiae]
MRKNYTVSALCLLLAAALGACREQGPAKDSAATTHQHGPLTDSTVTALTQPVNMRVVTNINAITPESGTRIYTAVVNGVVAYDTRQQTGIASRVGGRIEKLLIRYNYQPVKKGQLIMEVYSPELAAAQRELLLVARQTPNLLAGARQRLQLLGMQPAQVERVLQTGDIMYRVPVYSNADGYILEQAAAGELTAPAAAGNSNASSGGMGGMAAAAAPPPPAAPATTPVMLREGQYVSAGQPLFTIYKANNLVAEFSLAPAQAAAVRQGQKLLYHPVAEKNALQPGNIGLIEPVFRNGLNFSLARVYPKDNRLRPGQLLTAYIPVVYTGGWWLPEKAVWRLGSKAVVFRKENGTYAPYEVQAEPATHNMTRVLTGIGSWEVAANAAYLVDSESFIKTRSSWKEKDL